MADFHGVLSNFLGGGCDFTTVGDRRVRNSISLALNGFRIEILQQPRVAVGRVQRLRGQFVATTDVIVYDVPEKRLRFVRQLGRDLSWLLTFAALSPVRLFAHEYPKGSGRSTRISTVGVTNTACSPIDIRNGFAVRDYLLQVWPAYRRLKRTRQLQLVFDYLAAAEQPGQSMQVKLLLSFTALESLKYTYATEQGIPYRPGFGFYRLSAAKKKPVLTRNCKEA